MDKTAHKTVQADEKRMDFYELETDWINRSMRSADCCRYIPTSLLPRGLTLERCPAPFIAESYLNRTAVQLSRCWREFSRCTGSETPPQYTEIFGPI